MAAVKAALLPGLEFVTVIDPKPSDQVTVARLAYRSGVRMGPHGAIVGGVVVLGWREAEAL